MLNAEDTPVIAVTEGSLRALRKTRGWVLFLAIISVVGAVFSGIFLLLGIGVLARQSQTGITFLAEGAVFLVIAVLFAVFWFGYSGALRRLSTADENINETLERIFVRQRRLWVLQGVIVFILVALAIAAAIIFPIIVHAHPNLLKPV